MNISADIASTEMDEPGSQMPVEHLFGVYGEFVNPQREAEFLDATWSEYVERMNAIQLAVLCYVGWGVVDYFIIGMSWVFVAIMALRILALLITRIPTLFFSKFYQRRAFFAAVTFAQIYVFSVVVLSVYAGTLSISEQALSVLPLIFAFYFGVPNRLVYNTAVSIGCTLLFVAVIAGNDDTSWTSVMVVLTLLGIGNVCGAQFARVTAKLRRNEFLTLQEQKKLNEQLISEVASRQEAQRIAAATEENFQSIFVAAPEALAVVEPGTYRIIQANRKAHELFGPEQGLTGKDARALFVDKELRKRFDDAAHGLRPRASIEAQLFNASGEPIWTHISVAFVRFHGIPALLVALQDVTARRHEAEALREARDQANDASRSKSEFLANMSHELRTPLNAIIGFSEALERELFGPVGNPRYLEYAGDIHDSGVHLLNLINDILDLSKIEAGHFKLHEEEADLDDIVASACRIVRHRAQQASINIEIDLPTPTITLLADERALKQVLINLISNAVKFSNDCGTVRVEAEFTVDGLCLSVIDNGIGIAEEDIPRALAPFTQVDGTLSRSHEGTGLGLPLAKYMTELHEGSLLIDSTPGVGTRVSVVLPASRLAGRSAESFATQSG
ncbi:MAG: PAS domain-containing sensor histidine kinase [Parvibaculum sp.]